MGFILQGIKYKTRIAQLSAYPMHWRPLCCLQNCSMRSVLYLD